MTILQLYPGKVWGGAEEYIYHVSRALAETHAHTTIAVCLDKGVAPATLRRRGIEPHTISGSSAKELTALLGRVDIMVVHDSSFVPLAVKAARRADHPVRVIFTRHIARGSRVLPWQRRYYRALDKIIFVSELARDLWLEANRWYPRERTVVVHNSVCPPSAPLPELDTDTPLLLFTGRVRRSKGCETILHALAKCRDLHFKMLFVGAPKPADYPERLMRLATKLGIADRVSFEPFTDNVWPYIHRATLGVCPSIVREALHLTPMEMMAAGRCVITSVNGAQREYITDGVDGILIDPTDVDALAAAIRAMLTDPERRRTIAERAALHFAQELAYPRFLSKITSTYSKGNNN